MVTLHSCQLPPQAVEAATLVATLLPAAPLSEDVEDKVMDGDAVDESTVPPGALDEPLSVGICTIDMPVEDSDEALLSWAKRVKRRHGPY